VGYRYWKVCRKGHIQPSIRHDHKLCQYLYRVRLYRRQWAKVTAKSGLEYTGVVLRGATDATTYYVGYGHRRRSTLSRNGLQVPTHNWRTRHTDYGGERCIEFRAVGTALSLLVNGQTILTATDSDISSGYAGIAFYGTTATGDDWESGNIEGTPAGPTITASPWRM